MVMRKASKSLKMPMTIICADIPPFQGSESVRWKQCMKKFASHYPNRKYLLAKNAGHYIFIDSPKIVIDEIINRYNEKNKLLPSAAFKIKG